MTTIIAFSDTHEPWSSKKCKAKVYDAIRCLSPDYIIHLGDLYDMLNFSRFAHSQQVYTAKQELLQARLNAQFMWRHINKIKPRKCKLYQLHGNHDDRPIAMLLRQAPTLEPLFNVKTLFDFENVNQLETENDELIVNGIVFQHGFKTKLGDHCKMNMMPTVCGHSHKGGVLFWPLKDKVIWELNVGHCCDHRNSIPFGYTKRRLFSSWTPGFGVIDNYGPRFVSI